MLTIEEVLELKKQGKNREIITGVPEKELRAGEVGDDTKLLEVGWAHHQLGEYEDSVRIMVDLYNRYTVDTVIGEAARRGFAHGLLQRDGDIEEADSIMRELPSGLVRDNVRMNLMIEAARKGIEIPALEIILTVSNAMKATPFATVNGHVINNACLALHEAREQEEVKPYLAVLTGLIEMAIGIYEATNSPKNHLAGACYRGSLIFKAAGPSWYKGAELLALASYGLWQELRDTQGGERYQRNLEGAESQLKEIQELLRAQQ